MKVKLHTCNRMLADHATASSAARKYYFRFPGSGLQEVVFKKRNGKKRDLLQILHRLDVNGEVFDKIPVYRVTGRLKMKQFKGNIGKGLIVYGI